MNKKAVIVIALIVVAGAAALLSLNAQKKGALDRDISRISNSSNSITGRATVDIINYSFKDQVIKVKKGTTVTWTNQDNAPHTVTGDSDPSLSSQVIGKGNSYEKTFDQIGTYKYHCTPHPQMIAAVIVVE